MTKKLAFISRDLRGFLTGNPVGAVMLFLSVTAFSVVFGLLYILLKFSLSISVFDFFGELLLFSIPFAVSVLMLSISLNFVLEKRANRYSIYKIEGATAPTVVFCSMLSVLTVSIPGCAAGYAAEYALEKVFAVESLGRELIGAADYALMFFICLIFIGAYAWAKTVSVFKNPPGVLSK